ncbi:MAG: hypothetical protein WC979_05260 [Candidatus Pacearchaeota archaeon]|jgi:S1 RNA binding domain protein
MDEQFEEGQIVLCVVDKIIGTTVFVKLEGNGEGTVTTSEIAPGRIRNLREYVVPNKTIVCKILSIRDGKIQLSLRRVKPNEKKELLEKVNKEKSYKAIIKTASGKEEFEKTIEKISENYSILDFFNEIKQNPKVLDKYFNKENSEKILKILDSKKEKPKEIRQLFKLSTKSSDGIKIVKSIILEACDNSKCNVSYLAAGRYSLNIIGDDFKAIKAEVNQILETIEKSAKKQHCDFIVEKN